MKASVIAINGGSIDIHPGITVLVNDNNVSFACFILNDLVPILSKTMSLKKI